MPRAGGGGRGRKQTVPPPSRPPWPRLLHSIHLGARGSPCLTGKEGSSRWSHGPFESREDRPGCQFPAVLWGGSVPGRTQVVLRACFLPRYFGALWGLRMAAAGGAACLVLPRHRCSRHRHVTFAASCPWDQGWRRAQNPNLGCLLLCGHRHVTQPLCASLSPPVKWVQRWHRARRVGIRL